MKNPKKTIFGTIWTCIYVACDLVFKKTAFVNINFCDFDDSSDIKLTRNILFDMTYSFMFFT